MTDIPRIDSVPMACPKCAGQSGFPYKAQTITNRATIELSMRCHDCGHQWIALFERIPPSTTTTPNQLTR